jgi:uncharacterized protein YnzC (UPF0291/DUF896 family)
MKEEEMKKRERLRRKGINSLKRQVKHAEEIGKRETVK